MRLKWVAMNDMKVNRNNMQCMWKALTAVLRISTINVTEQITIYDNLDRRHCLSTSSAFYSENVCADSPLVALELKRSIPLKRYRLQTQGPYSKVVRWNVICIIYLLVGSSITTEVEVIWHWHSLIGIRLLEMNWNCACEQ